VSRETIYKYEKGESQTYPETALKLEEILNQPITLSINIFEPVDNKNSLDQILEPKELINLGYDIKSSNKVPFDAISEKPKNSEEIEKLKEKLQDKINEIEELTNEISKKTQQNHILITNMERNRNQEKLDKIAESTDDISSVTGHDALFVLDNTHENNSINKIPAIYTWELKDMEKIEELQKLIKERKEDNS